MDLRGFLVDLMTWSLRETACAAGLAVLSAGAGYSLYRGLRRGSAPPDHTQPPHEPVDELEESLDSPSVFQLLPFEPHQEPSAVILPLSAGELDSTWCNVHFLSSDFYGSESGLTHVKRCFLGMVRGPERRLCWAKRTETLYINHMGFPYHAKTEDWFTSIRIVSGRVEGIMSCNHLETVINMAREDSVHSFTEVTHTYLLVGPDDQEDSDTWTEESSHRTPYSNAESQSDSEECEKRLSPEEMEVPFISTHLADRGVTDVGVKLCALRQAFSTLLASIHNVNFLFVVGKKIVMRLAATNNQDVAGVQLAYESLIRFLRRPRNQNSVEAELFGVQLHNYNFLDVFYELLLFRFFLNGSAPEAFEGGFLERLFALIDMWDVDVWKPAAGQYFTVLIDKLLLLCEVLFSQPLELYGDPAALTSAVLRLLKQHVQLMMDTLEKL